MIDDAVDGTWRDFALSLLEQGLAWAAVWLCTRETEMYA